MSLKCKINKTELDKHISIAQRAISNRSSIQILEGIVFTTKEDELILSSTDLELSVETRVKCDVYEEGSVVIKSNLIGSIIRKMPQDIVTITVENENVNIKCQNSIFDIPCQSSLEYPSMPEIKEDILVRISNIDLINSVKETSFATSIDESRLALTGILFEVSEEDIKFVGLDGYRLALKKVKNQSNVEISSIVPKRAFTELIKILDDEYTDIIIVKGHIVFMNKNTKLYSKLIDKKYIDYARIISSNHSTKITLNRNDFINSLDRAQLLATGSTASLSKISFENGKVHISSNSDFGKLDEVIFAKQEGEDLSIAFNTRYLLDGLKVIEEDEVVLNLNDSLSPAIIHPINDTGEYIYLVLPVRLSK